MDFIKRYIFPGGCLPSLTVISYSLSRVTDMQMSYLRDITRDYADTLSAWHDEARPARYRAADGLRRPLHPHVALLPQLLRGGWSVLVPIKSP